MLSAMLSAMLLCWVVAGARAFASVTDVASPPACAFLSTSCQLV
jgi:hypothetical protein